jgi:hypothetical protein
MTANDYGPPYGLKVVNHATKLLRPSKSSQCIAIGSPFTWPTVAQQLSHLVFSRALVKLVSRLPSMTLRLSCAFRRSLPMAAPC